MTIHSDHPFQTPEADRSVVRRWRGRLPAPVTVVTSAVGPDRAGLTVSSVNIVEGEQSCVVLLIDPDSDLADILRIGSTLAVIQLSPGDEYQAEAFAGLVPAPGGPFTLGQWKASTFGPVLEERTWLGGVVVSMNDIGWSRQVVAEIRHLEFAEHATLSHVRGKFK